MARLYARVAKQLIFAAGAVALACLWPFGAAPARAATFVASPILGVLQQPTSHYYSAMYGLDLAAETASQGLIGRLSYIERPEFRADGYADKDLGYFAMVGTKLTKQAGQGLFAYIGDGTMAGYTKITTQTNNTGNKSSSTYSLSGVTTAVAYAIRLGPFDLAAEHQVFIGFVDRAQLAAYVAWPFSFYQVRIGLVW